jgi:hypothetical protein
LQALADLLMCQVLAALHGLNKAGFFLEIPSNDYRRNLIRGAALLRRGARYLRFCFGWKMYFHVLGFLHSGYQRDETAELMKSNPRGRHAHSNLSLAPLG